MKTHHHAELAIVVSQFNKTITDKLLQGTVSRLIELGINKDQITVVHVPGAIEIPLTTKLIAKSKRYCAIICLGAVIQGETNHHEYVSQQVSQGCLQVMMEYEIPIIFGVLTTKNIKQALARVSDKIGHKGIESAEAAAQMIKTLADLQ